jgi:FkbM family methyltransferase
MSTETAAVAVQERTLQAVSQFLCTVLSAYPCDDTAAKVYRWAAELFPGNALAWNGLGRAALLKDDFEEALRYFKIAAGEEPRTATLWANASVANARMGLLADAERCCKKALDCDPKNVPAWVELCSVYNKTGNLEGLRWAVEEGLKVEPENPNLHYARAVSGLLSGDPHSLLEDYEYRPSRLFLRQRLDCYEEWDGSPLTGKTLLVCGEQGLGDQIMFARCIPELLKRGGRVIIQSQRELIRLFSQSFPSVEFIGADWELKQRGIEIDCWTGIASLPLRLGKMDFLLRTEPYLKATNPLEFSCLIPHDGRLRVGLCWCGNPDHALDKYRSFRWEDLELLKEIQGLALYSLQMGDRESGLANLTDYCMDVADTASILQNLDYVVTCDTALLHLAGAVGCPAIGLLGFPSDWRWRNSSLYSTVETLKAISAKEWAPSVEVAGNVLRKAARQSPLALPTKAGAVQERSEAMLYGKIACRYGTFTYLRTDRYVGRSLEEYEEYSEGEVDLFRRVLKPEDSVVEAGANIGALTVPLSHLVSGRKVRAFEPQPDNFALLLKNTLGTPCEVACYNLALGSEEKWIPLPRLDLQRVVNAGGFEVDRGYAEGVSVRQTMLDSFDFPVDFLKVDVEGMELEVLKGGEKKIARYRPILYVENDRARNSQALIEWIHEHKYRIYRHNPPLYNPDNFRGNKINVFGNVVSMNLLCVPMERKDLRFEDMERVRVKELPL